ncbi:CLPTM1-like membrane protein [Strigomonas culicis]|nr:CLPTM1-like membrane protein [Strigomonas culicis]|eukprot:EPY37237.1 CLPTM1-like membrane protein [Strigomonas culicis]
MIEWSMSGESFTNSTPLIWFHEKKVKREVHLFGNHSEPEHEEPHYASYMQPVLTLSPVVDVTDPLPPHYLAFTQPMKDSLYAPVVYINNFWVLNDHLLEVNETTVVSAFNFTVEVVPLAAWRVLMHKQYEESLRQQATMGMGASVDIDEVKRVFLETNHILLAVTAIVTVLHMVFEYLAFSNTVKFWKGKKDFTGLSLRTIALDCYCQTIIFLYLLDSEETSWTVLLPSGIGVLTEYWKLMQTMSIVRVTPSSNESEGSVAPSARRGWRVLGYSISFSASYDKRTRKHDDTAVRYLVYIMIPILIIYSVYSAVYETHKGWYSFLVNTQVQFIYFFGFVMMTPQIFINYKLKSVGQLPWRTFIYKSLNTVIDDLFSFIIKMPWLHRIACFRDDVVFAILLYQRWIYPVDTSRSADGDDDDDEGQDEDNKHQDAVENEEQKALESVKENETQRDENDEEKKKQ